MSAPPFIIEAARPAAVPTQVVPVRREPTHRSELVSQWIMGEIITVEAVEGSWLRAHGPDGYVGWTPSAPLRQAAFTGEEWDRAATLRSLGTTIESGSPGSFERVPWGARMCPGEDGTVLLPDGRIVVPASPGRLIPRAEAGGTPGDASELPMAPDTLERLVVSRSRDWLGAPYLWGGRTELGVDCSGLVQALYASVGVALPRDSHQQFEADSMIAIQDGAEPGDLVFFSPEGGAVTHVALSLGGSAILHAASSNGRVREDDLEANDPLAVLLAGSAVGLTRPSAR